MNKPRGLHTVACCDAASLHTRTQTYHMEGMPTVEDAVICLAFYSLADSTLKPANVAAAVCHALLLAIALLDAKETPICHTS